MYCMWPALGKLLPIPTHSDTRDSLCFVDRVSSQEVEPRDSGGKTPEVISSYQEDSYCLSAQESQRKITSPLNHLWKNSLLFGCFGNFSFSLSVVPSLQKHVHRREASNDSSGLHNSGSEEEEEGEGGEREGGRWVGEGQIEDGGSNSEGEGKVRFFPHCFVKLKSYALSFQPPQKKAKRYIYI